MNARKSRQLHVLRGWPGKQAHHKDDRPPSLPNEAPACPEDVKSDPVAFEAWEYYAPILLASGNLTKADRSILKSLCLTTSLLEQARKHYREGMEVEFTSTAGRTKQRTIAKPRQMSVIGPRGAAVKNPFLVFIEGYQREERLYCQSLGLEPHIRGLNVAPVERKDTELDGIV